MKHSFVQIVVNQSKGCNMIFFYRNSNLVCELDFREIRLESFFSFFQISGCPRIVILEYVNSRTCSALEHLFLKVSYYDGQ